MNYEPSPWVRAWASEIPPSGTILDLACGEGRHAHFLGACGHPILALDRRVPGKRASPPLGSPKTEGGARGDTLPLEKTLPGPGFRLFDLEVDLEETERFLRREAPFSAVVVVNYLFRPLLPLLPELLAEDGLLIYETFMQGQESLGRPSNPEYLLKPDELRLTFEGALQLLGFEEGYGLDGQPGYKQRYCGRK